MEQIKKGILLGTAGAALLGLSFYCYSKAAPQLSLWLLPAFLASGAGVGLFCACVTRRLLKASRDDLENLLQSVPLPLIISSKDRRIAFVNEKVVELFGKAREEIVGRPCCSLQTPLCATESCAVEQLEKNGVDTVPFTMGGRHFIVRSATVEKAGLQPGSYIQVIQDVTDIVEAQQQIRVSEERYRIAADSNQDIILDYNVASRTLYQTERAVALYGIPQLLENVPQSVLECGVVDPKSTGDFLVLFQKLERGEKYAACDLLCHTSDGREIWNRLTFSAIFDDRQRPVRAVGILRNITSTKEAERLYEQEARYRQLTMKDTEFYYEANLTQQRFEVGHEQLTAAYLPAPTDSFDTVVQLLLDHMVYQQDRELVAGYIRREALAEAYRNGVQRQRFEYRRQVTGGGWCWVECNVYLSTDLETGDIRCIGYIKNIDEAKKRELAYRKKAERDLLTSLYNKVTTENLVKEFLEGSATPNREDLRGAFLLIDLDNFKKINDTMGHAFGDSVLSQVSAKLLTMFRGTDLLGRLGGDEFCVFMTFPTSQAQVLRKAGQICQVFRDFVVEGKGTYKVSGSIGISLYPEHGTTFQSLYENADKALYCAKGVGKDTYFLYDPSMAGVHQWSGPAVVNKGAGQVFAKHLVEYVLRILYEASVPDAAIHAILSLAARNFRFSRSYVLEPRGLDGWRCTFEWCEEGITRFSQVVPSIPSPLMKQRGLRFQQGVCQATQIEKLPSELRDYLRPLEAKTLLWFSVMESEALQAVIGFDNCLVDQPLFREEHSNLQLVSMLLGTFLLHSHLRLDYQSPEVATEQVMENIRRFVYVVDPETYELCYVNRFLKETYPGALSGRRCYQTLNQMDTPCTNCPVARLMAGPDDYLQMKRYMESTQKWIDINASKIQWHGGKACCLLDCKEQPAAEEQQENKPKNKQ